MAGDDTISNGEIVRRLDSIQADVRSMSGTFVRTDLYESQRQETGRRTGDVERDIEQIKAQREADKLEADRRYRTTVNLFIGGGISLFGGLFLFVLQLVTK
jgi:hypothetical protein